ncbi:MAG: hypothetical protein IJ617_06640, partial [Oscillospiraceae bacterium]|nr:hypothetical protein [Oscillospiraceae bacterium]
MFTNYSLTFPEKTAILRGQALKEALNKSTCADWRGNSVPIKAQKRRNPVGFQAFATQSGAEFPA